MVFNTRVFSVLMVTFGLLYFGLGNMVRAETQSPTAVASIGELNENTLTAYVEMLSKDFYQQQQLIKDYFRLYQERRDQRAYNVWYLRSFVPTFNELNAQHQQFYQVNADFLAGRPEQDLHQSIAALETIASRLMIAVREHDAATYKLAVDLNQTHSEIIAEALTRHQLADTIQTITLN